MRGMTGQTFTGFHGRMLHLGFFEEVVVALKAHRFAGTHQEEFVGRVMWGMTGQTFTGLHGRMLHLGFFEEVIVTLEAHRFTSAHQEELVGGLVGMMTRQALARLDWRMFGRGRRQNLRMARGAHFLERALHSLGELRLVTVVALFILEGYVPEHDGLD